MLVSPDPAITKNTASYVCRLQFSAGAGREVNDVGVNIEQIWKRKSLRLTPGFMRRPRGRRSSDVPGDQTVFRWMANLVVE